tara:strand:+ start:143 stop:1321 length:1179 start_codon:yes stop_codon:yes gene_type:complete
MRETQSGRTKGTTSRGVAVAILASFLFVVLGWMLVVPAPATADVAISDKLSIFGDFRARYEMDEQDRDNTGAVDRDRDRARIRARFGFKHKTTDKISFGMRFATRADALQSPHQDLDVTDGNSGTFGLDRAYVETKWGKSGFAWFGKHGISFWEQNEQFWDGDIQPEGVGAGYKFGLASGASLLLQSTFTYLNEEGWSDRGDADGTFEDDFGATLQAVYNKGPLTAAVGSLFIGSQGGNNSFQGGSATYTLASIQYKTKAGDLPLKLGYDWLHGENVVNDGAANFVTGGSKDETGYVVNASTKKGKWGYQFKYYHVPLNSVPLQGQVSQDNFPQSTNFRGQRYQVGYNLGSGMKADFRIYHQEILAGVSNAQNWTQAAENHQRYQVNLNLKF